MTSVAKGISLTSFVVFVAATDIDYGTIGVANLHGGAIKWTLLIGTSLLVAVPAVLRDDVRRVRSDKAIVAFALFFSWGLLSAGWSVDPGRTLTVWLLMAVGVVAGVSVTLRWGWVAVARSMVLLGIALGAASLIVELAAGPQDRWAGVSDSPTSLARTGIFTCVFALALLAARRSRVLAPIGLTAGLLTILASGTRAALATVGMIGLAALISRVDARNRNLTALGGVAFAGLVGAAFWRPVVGYFTREDPNVDFAEANGRSRLWPIGLDYVAERPLRGYGLGSGETLWARAVTDGLVQWFARHAHQLVLELLLATGFVGLVLFCLGTFSAARARHSTAPFVNRSLIFSLLALGLTEAVVETESMAFPVLGIAMAAGSRHGRAHQRENQR